MSRNKIGIVGGGAAGFFAAVNIAGKNNDAEITILEKSPRLLSKVRISGGGRCNVTNIISNPREFTSYYPRGAKELISVFSKFGSPETIRWFESRGVKLKTENDGRVFPVTDDSNTIIDLFLASSKEHGIRIVTGFDVNEIARLDSGKFIVYDRKRIAYSFDKILYCPGGFPDSSSFNCVRKLGHKIIEPVPSLFSFVCKSAAIKGLQGLSVPDAELKISGTKYSSAGSLLITHDGFSGPAALKLSAFAARELYAKEYKFKLEISWIRNDCVADSFKENTPDKKIINTRPEEIPARLWKMLVEQSDINPEKKWRDVSNAELLKLNRALINSVFDISGKNTNKEEFVTAGGISLKEIDFRTMESKLCKNLFFAGEVLDIDGITGGFNFQNAWSTAYIAASNL
ncbi:MAG: NAD(P)/FAD-dependent oxidoreductase [Ignavibacteria bacterium]